MHLSIPELRARYKPERIRLLFVAESPPNPRDGELRFFYNPELATWDHLFHALMEVVFDDYQRRAHPKSYWLRRFQEAGFYLIDATDEPVNHLRGRERRETLRAALPYKLAEMRELVSRETPIVLVKKNVFELMAGPLREQGMNVIHDAPLPFPSNGWQRAFINQCQDVLTRAGAGIGT